MGGFTRPRDMRVTNWMPGGRYLLKNKLYDNPVSVAYTPHTAFLLKSRYFVKQGLGRTNCPEYVVGYCPASQFQRYLRRINSGWAADNLLESMDNACWPGIAQEINLEPTKWWENGQDPDILRKEALGELSNPASVLSEGESQSLKEGETPSSSVADNASDTALAPEIKAEEEDAYKSDDDLDQNLAQTEKARNERKARLRALVAGGATAKEVANDISTPSFPEHTYNLRAKKPPSKLTHKQLGYVSNKAMLREYARYLSHTPDDNVIPVNESKLDDNLRNPEYVDTALAGTMYQYRKQYIPTLKDTPFWIPVLAITFPTRPLARVVSRLAKALPRGLPYYASMPGEDLKCKLSYPSRILNLRLTRMRRLAIQTAERLAGYFGGFPGLRYDHTKPGRGINGTLLRDPP